ncbi:DNA-binding enhancer protein-related [Theobroma cacao]|uniref:DNA-binding enhancer protein-related n=1 Tax=Theobroma cacao TaxID=3641 RepID=A0A061EQ22_THECC|nr:DNA-binding enhancer protein-related [Theobroma cacao]
MLSSTEPPPSESRRILPVFRFPYNQPTANNVRVLALEASSVSPPLPPSKSISLREKQSMEAGDGGVDRVVDSKDLQQQSKAFDKLVDRVEDRQLDSSRVQTAMASIAASAEAEKNAMRMREKELAAVKINTADVDIIANELELDKTVAERTLREHKGDAVAAIRSLLH